MIIAGGSYAERCLHPDWNRLFGSGLRAAVAASSLSPNSELHTYAPPAYRSDILATLSGVEVKPVLTPSKWEGDFEWLHPFELVKWDKPAEFEPPINVAGEVVLRFGMLEGDARVKGRRVVYDPQSEEPAGFFANGSEAEDLALIMTPWELVRMIDPKSNSFDNIRVGEALVELFTTQKTKSLMVVLKDKLGGVTVFLGDEPTRITTYAAESFFRIGAGDVFAAAFAYAWGEQQQGAIDAADYAARCLAYFVDGPRLPLPLASALPTRRFTGRYPEAVRILGHEQIEMGALLVHTEAWMEALNCKPMLELFEPEIKPNGSIPALVLVGSSHDERSLERLAERAGGSGPRVVFWPGASQEWAARYFPGARVTGDYATALYHALRGAIE